MPREERRKQLLQVAVRVFARRGIGSARHAEIATEAQVAVPTVFSYFPSREELVAAVLQEVDQFLVALVSRGGSGTGSASEKMLAIVAAFADSVESHPDHIRVWLNWSTAVQRDIWPLYEDFQQRILGTFEEIVRTGQAKGELTSDVDPETAAYLVVGSGQMIAQMKFTQRDPDHIRRYLETLIHGALHQS